MAGLRRVLEGLGLEDVSTYLQSGNAVFDTDEVNGGSVKPRLQEALAAEFGFDVPVVIVTGTELGRVIDACPYRMQGDADPTKVHVTFLSAEPEPTVWDSVAPHKYAPDDFKVGERVVYMHLPDGLGRSALAATLGKVKTGVVATTRNWRTVAKLAELTS